MLAGIVAWLLDIIKLHGAAAVFLGVLAEEIIIPIPSPLILMAAGFLLINPSLPLSQAFSQSFFIIVIPAAIAGTLGSFFPYYIGRYARRGSKRWQGYIGIKPRNIRYFEKKFKRNSFAYIALSRAFIVIPMSFVSFAAGFFQLPKGRFAAATFAGSIPRALLLSLMGWYFGNAFLSVAESLGFIEGTILILVIAAIAFFAVTRIRKKA